MEIDNSNSKSSLKIQGENLNQEVRKFTENLSEALRAVKTNLKVERAVQWILKTYIEEPIKLVNNEICTSRNLNFKIEDYLDLSLHTTILMQKFKELQSEEYAEFEKEFIAESKKKILLDMEEVIKAILKRANELVSSYSFYLKDSKDLKLSFYTNTGLIGTMVFSIDVK